MNAPSTLNAPMTLEEIFVSSFRKYFPILKNIFLLIFLIALVKDIPVYTGLPKNFMLQTIIFIVEVALIVYLWSVSLYMTNLVLWNEKPNLSESARHINYKLFPIYLACICFIAAVGIILFLMVKLLTPLMLSLVAKKQMIGIVGLILAIGLPLLFFIVLFFFTIPLIITDDLPCFTAFGRSAALVGVQNWLRVLSVYFFLLIIFYIVSTNTLHGHKLATHYLSFPFDLIVFLITIPVFNAFIILLKNDLQAREEIESV